MKEDLINYYEEIDNLKTSLIKELDNYKDRLYYLKRRLDLKNELIDIMKSENEKLQQENQELKQALLDIKEYIEKNIFIYPPFGIREDMIKVVFNKEERGILEIINKTLGSDK